MRTNFERSLIELITNLFRVTWICKDRKLTEKSSNLGLNIQHSYQKENKEPENRGKSSKAGFSKSQKLRFYVPFTSSFAKMRLIGVYLSRILFGVQMKKGTTKQKFQEKTVVLDA